MQETTWLRVSGQTETTMWVADRGTDTIFAYNMSTKARDSNKDLNTLIAAGNTSPYGLWSDGTTMWVAEHINNIIHAYSIVGLSRWNSVEDFNTLSAASNNVPLDMWSDGTTNVGIG